jgi:hypothetical protein
MTPSDIIAAVDKYRADSGSNDRYTSFDYCYNYFVTTTDLEQDMEKSCLTLGFYLASWGMFRGSSFLLQKSLRHFQPVISYINNLDKSYWEIDVDKYDNYNIQKIIEAYSDLKDLFIPTEKAHLTLITKVLLGVFGFIPAFDNNFCNSFRRVSLYQCGFRKVNVKSLMHIKNFYDSNFETIDNLSKITLTTDFKTGQKTKINYPKAKIIDMFGFITGQ